MKTLKFLSVSALVLVMAACGGKKEENTEVVTEGEVPAAVVEGAETVIAVQDGVEAVAEEGAEVVSEEVAAVDINELLKKYESVATKYIETAKKVAKGDITAATQLASLQNDYNQLTKDLEAVKNQMTAEQQSELAKIAQKVLEAVK